MALTWPSTGSANAPLPEVSPRPEGAPLRLSVEGLRSHQGLLQICLTANPAHFPDCTGDPAARRLTVPASRPGGIVLPDVPPGNYALSIIHDANSNRKLDTFAGIPREGIGFSRNPVFHFGPPAFKDARFAFPDSGAGQQVKIRYFL